MNESTETKNFEKTLNAISDLTEDDAKSILKIIYSYINTAMTGNGGDEFKIEVIEKLFELYEKIPELNDIRKK